MLAAVYQLKPWEVAGGAHEFTFGELEEFLDQLPDIELRQAMVVPSTVK